MRTVNLLPDWYHQQRRQRRNLRLHLGLMFVLGVVMIGTDLLGRQRLASLSGRHNELERQLTLISDPEAALEAQQAELLRVKNLELAYRELGKPIPMSKVIQQLQNDMATGMALSHVLLDVHPEPVKGSGVVGDTKSPPRYHDVLHLTVVGIAKDNDDITHLFGKISANPLFSAISLDYMRGAILKGYAVRQFELQMQMDLDRLTNQDPDTLASVAAPAAGASNHGR